MKMLIFNIQNCLNQVKFVNKYDKFLQFINDDFFWLVQFMTMPDGLKAKKTAKKSFS